MGNRKGKNRIHGPGCSISSAFESQNRFSFSLGFRILYCTTRRHNEMVSEVACSPFIRASPLILPPRDPICFPSIHCLFRNLGSFPRSSISAHESSPTALCGIELSIQFTEAQILTSELLFGEVLR